MVLLLAVLFVSPVGIEINSECSELFLEVVCFESESHRASNTEDPLLLLLCEDNPPNSFRIEHTSPVGKESLSLPLLGSGADRCVLSCCCSFRFGCPFFERLFCFCCFCSRKRTIFSSSRLICSLCFFLRFFCCFTRRPCFCFSLRSFSRNCCPCLRFFSLSSRAVLVCGPLFLLLFLCVSAGWRRSSINGWRSVVSDRRSVGTLLVFSSGEEEEDVHVEDDELP